MAGQSKGNTFEEGRTHRWSLRQGQAKKWETKMKEIRGQEQNALLFESLVVFEIPRKFL